MRTGDIAPPWAQDRRNWSNPPLAILAASSSRGNFRADIHEKENVHASLGQPGRLGSCEIADVDFWVVSKQLARLLPRCGLEFSDGCFACSTTGFLAIVANASVSYPAVPYPAVSLASINVRFS